MEEEERHRKRLGERFEQARNMLGLSKGSAAKPCGLLPRDIAQIEDGTKRFIPTPYLQFLSNAIDLNSLFDNTIPVRLRPPETAAPRIPAVDATLAANQHIQAVAGPPEWLREVLASQERIKQELKTEILKELLAAQKGATPTKGRKTG